MGDERDEKGFPSRGTTILPLGACIRSASALCSRMHMLANELGGKGSVKRTACQFVQHFSLSIPFFSFLTLSLCVCAARI